MSKLNKRIDQTIRELNSKITKTKMDISQISRHTPYSYKAVGHKRSVLKELRTHINSLEGMKEVE